MKKIFGLIGKNISYSFSKKYFTKKFYNEKLPYSYINFDIDSIEELPEVLNNNIELLKGLNVTIPYKESVLKYLDEIDLEAKKIGAVNTIKIIDKYYLKGFNTDVYGFENSLKPLLQKHHKSALIFGAGGASKAVKYVLEKLDISFTIVSRNPNKNEFSYNDITETVIKKNKILINCTPVGIYPNINESLPIPYQAITSKHLLYDLIYNPNETAFLKKGKEHRAITKNGLEMLKLQADKSWKIWNEK
jgi:shikimate dehydrogenase